MKSIATSILMILTGFLYSCRLSAQGRSESLFGEVSKKESLIPIRPGEPGVDPFWNTYAKRFIYAPSFDYKFLKNASKYKYEILCMSDSSTYNFESKVPYAPLSPVWAKIPVSYFNLKVIGISANGDSIGLAGQGTYYHAAHFNDLYHRAVIPYDSSSMIALSRLLHESYVNYWLLNKEPDPAYLNYQYPAKMFSALIVGAVTYARLTPHINEAKRAMKIAVIVADYLLKISFPKGGPLEYIPPTYYGKSVTSRNLAPYIRISNCMPVYGARAGNAYLDLYDLNGDKRYLQAAKRIAYTYLKTQLKNGSWYLYVNPTTGEPTASVGNIAIPTYIINYFDRLRKNYKMKGLEMATEKALKWIMTNPVKTFNWQGQFEDAGAHDSYKDQSEREACELAIYLFKNYNDNSQYLKLAEELVRFSEDQFVIWENPRYGGTNNPSDWITPCVQEQYAYWMPVCLSASLLMKTFWYAYSATKKEIYLAKAISLANTTTVVQKVNHGSYSTYFTKHPVDQWLNCIVYSAKEMLRLSNNLKKAKLKSDLVGMIKQ